MLYLCKIRGAELVACCHFDCERKAFGYFTLLGRLDEEVSSFIFLFKQDFLFLLLLSLLGLALFKVLKKSIDQSNLLDLGRKDMVFFEHFRKNHQRIEPTEALGGSTYKLVA